MKTKVILLILMITALCLTGCDSDSDVTTVQGNTIPVVIVETTFRELTYGTAPEQKNSESTKTSSLKTTAVNTGKSTTAADKSKTTTASNNQAATAVGSGMNRNEQIDTDTNTEGTAVSMQRNETAPVSVTETTASGESVNIDYDMINGRWETVSFIGNNGRTVAYDLSDPAHRAQYIGIEVGLRDERLIFGTRTYTANCLLHGNVLSVMTVDGSYDKRLTVSDDAQRMTVDVFGDGSVNATLMRVSDRFSIDSYLTADAAVDVSFLTGDWSYEVQDSQNPAIYNTSGYLTVEEDGTYIYQPKDGSLRRRGTINVVNTRNGSPIFEFRENGSNALWISMNESDSSREICYIGSNRAARLFKDPDRSSFAYFIGQWEYEGCTITVSDLGTEYGVEVRCEDCIWTYTCIGSGDGTRLECFGGGTLERVAANGARTVVYNDGTTVFRKRSGLLFWINGEDSRWMEAAFRPVG